MPLNLSCLGFEASLVNLRSWPGILVTISVVQCWCHMCKALVLVNLQYPFSFTSKAARIFVAVVFHNRALNVPLLQILFSRRHIHPAADFRICSWILWWMLAIWLVLESSRKYNPEFVFDGVSGLGWKMEDQPWMWVAPSHGLDPILKKEEGGAN